MNTELIGNLIRLRYKLLWAKTRTRNGKIALFFAGYLLLVFFLALMGFGGIGAGITAARMGKAYPIAAAVLGGLFVQALFATVILGFGVNSAFSEAELRRYPLVANERRFARHFLGIADPFWFLVLALELGLALGLYLVGAGSFWLGLIAVLLLFVTNYLFARVIALLVERLVVRKGGSAVLLAGVIGLSLIPAAVAPALQKHPHALDGLIGILAYTPPAGAATAMVRSGMAAAGGLLVIVWWMIGLVAAVVALENRPPQKQVAQAGELKFEGPLERIGSLFGPAYGPLITQWLRFYSRNNRFRTIYPLALPLLGFLIFTQTRGSHSKDQFATVLGVFALAGFISTAQFAVNQFGYLGGGFRRYLLLPADPEMVLRAGSYTFLLLSSVLIPLGAVVVLLMSPVHIGFRGFVMLIAAAIAGQFLVHGLALWSTLYGPRKANYNSSFGNDLSLAGNIVVIGGVLVLLFGPHLAVKLWPGAFAQENWWGVVLAAVAAVAFYVFSLRSAGPVLRARRERLLAVMEGRS